MARASKRFEYGKDKYYFNVSAGSQGITVHRMDKETAIRTFRNYEKVGKRCEWLGLWDGKKFIENKID